MIMGALVLFINYWVMPLFFLIAGGASHFSLSTRENKTYIIERFFRLVIPFIAGSIIFTLFLNYAEAMNHGEFSGSFPAFLRYEFNLCVSNITTGNIPFSPKIFGIIGHHLWFLMFLFIYSLIPIPLFRFALTRKRKISDATARKKYSDLRIYAGLPLLFLVSVLLSPLDPEYQGWSTFFQWGLFFIIGFFILSDTYALKSLRRRWRLHMIVGSVSFAVSACLLIQSNLVFFSSPEYTKAFALYALTTSITSWAWIFAFIGIGNNWLNSRNSVLPTLSKAAMPFYMVHQPVIIWCALFIVQLNIPIIAKFVLIFLISFSCTALFVRFLILPSKRISFLFGVKYPRVEEKELDFTDIIR